MTFNSIKIIESSIELIFKQLIDLTTYLASDLYHIGISLVSFTSTYHINLCMEKKLVIIATKIDVVFSTENTVLRVQRVGFKQIYTRNMLFFVESKANEKATGPIY